MTVDLAPYLLARRVGDVLDALGVPWAVGGSLASSVHGLPRSTSDVDLIAALATDQVDAAVRNLQPMGYLDGDVARTAVRTGRSFNLIDDETIQKVDVFCVSGVAAGQIARSRPTEVSPGLTLPVLCPEDIIVQKLRWYALGGRVSDRQRRDVVDVLQVQGAAIDQGKLRKLADDLDVLALLDETLVEIRRATRG